jgi:hypothetical protein
VVAKKAQVEGLLHLLQHLRILHREDLGGEGGREGGREGRGGKGRER